MMIANVSQLNKFTAKMGVESPRLIIPALAESGERISAQMAKLILDRQKSVLS